MRPGCSASPATKAAIGKMLRHVFTIHTSHTDFIVHFHTVLGLVLGLLKERFSSAEIIEN
jgi:hypothetical protein